MEYWSGNLYREYDPMGENACQVNLHNFKGLFSGCFSLQEMYFGIGDTYCLFGTIVNWIAEIRDKIKKQRFYLYYLLVLCLFLFSPFLLPVLMGAAPVVRGQLALPFCGCNWYTNNF